MTSHPPTRSGRRRFAALAVHMLTASGAGLAWPALLAAFDGRLATAFVWLAVALAVDGLDGPLARFFNVGEMAPRYDGPVLDLVVDFLTYVVIPMVIVWRADLLPPAVASGFAVAILAASALYFANTEMKAADNWFRGFPGCWNVVAFGLVAYRPSALVAGGVLLACAVLMFVPIRVVHPFRVRRLRWASAAAATVGGAAAVVLMAVDFGPAPWARTALGLALAYFAAAGVWPSGKHRPA